MYALIENGVVVNVIVWNGEAEWAPPEGQQAVSIASGSGAAIGWTWDGSAFNPPAG